MSLRYLLDTNVLSECLKPRPNPGVVARLDRQHRSIATAAPVWHELWFGCRRLPRSRRRRAIEDYLVDVVQATMPILGYDQAAADWHATQRARLEKLGLTPSFVDGQVAAIARVNDLALVTGDVEAFGRFQELEVEDWRR